MGGGGMGGAAWAVAAAWAAAAWAAAAWAAGGMAWLRWAAMGGGMAGGLQAAAGGLAGGMGGGWRWRMRRSDVALKHDIALLGHLDNGLGFYRFSYHGSDKAYVGVMAQEVQR